MPVYVNADVIAQGLSGFAPEAADREAAVLLLRRLEQLQARRESFAFESTLAGRGYAKRIRSLVEDGYHVHLLYLWLPDPGQAVARVRMRVRHGGHDIPPDTVRRRYHRSLRNVMELYIPLASAWRMYDGRGFAGPAPVPLIARGRGNQVLVQSEHTWEQVVQRFQALQRPGDRDDE